MPKKKQVRKFYGNRYTKLRDPEPAADTISSSPAVTAATSSADAPDNTSGDQQVQPTTTASSAKLSTSMVEGSDLVSDQGGNHFPDSVLMQTDLILNLLTRLSNSNIFCADHPKAKLIISVVPVCGIVCSFQFQCSNCNVLLENVVMSDRDASNTRYNLNTRLAFGTTLAGGHRSTAETITVHLGLLPPVAPSEWSKDITRLNNVTETHATESMCQAAREACESPENSDITVSCDGTWQRRGFASKNGVSTVITHSQGKPGKVIDVEVMTSYCAICSNAKGNPPQHNCKKNHNGSAGAMESVGMQRIFARSVANRGVRYVNFLGDGDCKSYKHVCDSEPYGPDVNITKLECVGHVQKRMGKRLIERVQQCKGNVYTLKGRKTKGIGGQNKLHSKAISRIQGHYGGNIRAHAGDLEGMKWSIWSIWYHRRRDHSLCNDSCPAVNGTGDGNANSLPDFVTDEIRSVFETLTDDSLLSRCLHGGTQNNNESFHSIIWSFCPKTVFVGKTRLQLAVNCGILQFNDGDSALVSVYRSLGIPVGNRVLKFAHQKNLRRVARSRRAAASTTKERRKSKSQNQARGHDTSFYDAGGF